MRNDGARQIFAEYLRHLPTERPRVLWVNEWVYLGETSLLEAYRWVKCTPVERKGRKVYRVTLTRLGVREARGMPPKGLPGSAC